MLRGALIALAAISFACALGLAWLFYELYWRRRDCFDEAGRCFLPEGAVISDGNFVWGLFAAMALAVGLLSWILSRRIVH